MSSPSKRLVFTAKQKVLIEEFDLGKPGAGEVVVRTNLSLMSTGTENIVFNRLFDPGTHWDNWVKYPFYPGYASVGVVEALGEGVDQLKVGQRVGFRMPHASHAIVMAVECAPIPDNVSDEHAVWFALAKITFTGAKAAEYSLGDSALIIGAGPIGQMSTRWARAGGCVNVIVVDPAQHRLPLAKAGGATAVITQSITEAKDAVLAAGDGKLPRVVMDSTGNAKVFQAALGLAANYGRVVIMGDTGSPATQSLTSDVMMRGITIVAAHDGHHIPGWDGISIAKLFFQLVGSGRFSMDGLTSHVFNPADPMNAYETANRDRATTMGLIFDWAGKLGSKK